MRPCSVSRVIGMPSIRTLAGMLVSEYLGTAFMLYFGCGSQLYGGNLLQIAIGWGFAITNIVQVFGPTCHTHINPAVTLWNVIYGFFSIPLGLLYMVFQVLGSLSGYLMLRLTIPEKLLRASEGFINNQDVGFCTNVPYEGSSALQAYCAETIGTTFLALLVCSIHDPRNRFYHDSLTVRVGVLIIADVLAVAHISTACLNPARWLGPALVNNVFVSGWVYIAGPFSGAIIAALSYGFIFLGSEPEQFPPEKVEAARNILGGVSTVKNDRPWVKPLITAQDSQGGAAAAAE